MTGSDSRNRTIMSDQNYRFQQIKHTDRLPKDTMFEKIFTKDSNFTLGNTFHIKKVLNDSAILFTRATMIYSLQSARISLWKGGANEKYKQHGCVLPFETAGYMRVCLCLNISNSFTNNPSDARDNFIMTSSPCPQHKDRWSASHCHLQQPHLNPALLFAALSSTFHRCSLHQWTISASKMSGF